MLDELKQKIILANDTYRLGEPIISDQEYDKCIELLREISPDDELLLKIGHVIEDVSRKRKLPIPMFSMNKRKNINELKDWLIKNNLLVLTPKYDGISLCVEELIGKATTRGDGEWGQDSDEHYQFINNKLVDKTFEFTFGEVILPKSKFDKYASEYANPRNLVAGLINSKEISDILSDLVYIKYGGEPIKPVSTKSELLDLLNQSQEIKVPYKVVSTDDITHELLVELFNEWGADFEIDGIIIEYNSIELQNKLGRDRSNNPQWAIAYKSPDFEEIAEANVLDVTWNISKNGYLKPVINIEPLRLNGVIISNITGNNARFIEKMGIGKGSIIRIVRSGMVIPKVVDVVKSVDFVYPNLGVDIKWNENNVELVTLVETDEQKIKLNIAFFEILEAANISYGVVNQLWDAGYKTIRDIINLKISDLEKIDRFGTRKATIVYNSIQKSIKNVSLSKLQHATGIFKGLGSLKLAKLEHFDKKPTLDEVMRIDGFAEISAKTYIDNYDSFFEFIKDLPIVINKNIEVAKISNDLDGVTFVFTGFRDKVSEELINLKGGKVTSSISKSTTYLVCKDISSGSSKLEKARQNGIKVISQDELNILIN